MKIKIEDSKIYVQSEYSADFVKEAKMIQGKWNPPYWVFPQENEEYVRDLLLRIYGENGLPQETVTIDIDLDEYSYGDEVKVGEVTVASRRSRDWAVKLADNAMLLKGEFKASGGSVRYPAVTCEKGTVIRVKGIPEALYWQVEGTKGITLVNDAADKKAQLTAEREKLMQRLAEIDTALAELQ